MSEEIKINKNNKSITFINNEIAFSQFGVADEILDLITNLQNQLQQKDNIIKEIKSQLDYLETYSSKEDVFEDMSKRLNNIEKIIDKENK